MKPSMLRPGRFVQRGEGFWSWVPPILLIILCGIFLVKLGPSYMEFKTLRSILDKLETNPQAVAKGVKGIKKHIERNFEINEVDAVKRQDVTIKSEPNRYLVGVDYEKRQHLFFNIDAVMHFEHHVWVPKLGE